MPWGRWFQKESYPRRQRFRQRDPQSQCWRCFLLQHLESSTAQLSRLHPQHASQGSFHSTFTLKDLGVEDAIKFRGVDASRSIPFALSQTQVAQQAKLNLRYSFSPGLLAQFSHLNVLLNGSLIASLPVPAKSTDVQDALTTSLTLPPELLARNNELGFQFIGHYTLTCEDPANTVLWGRVESNSSIEVSGSLLQLSDNLNMLPLPFYDESVGSTTATIPFAFAAQPDHQAMEAAGIVASWFGVRAKSRALTFPVTLGGELPKGNVVLFVQGPSAMPAGFDLHGGGPVIAMRANPGDPFGKVLVVAGDDGMQLVTAAQSLALENNLLQGPVVHVSDFQLPPARQADDAPLWLRTDQISPLWNYSANQALQSDGSGALPVYLRVPPDLYVGDTTTLPLHLDYRYNAVPLAAGSTMRISANGSLVNELPLPQRDNPKQMLNATVAVPLVSMRPFANTFLFNFFFQIPKMGQCRNNPPINLQGALLRSSYLDLRGLNHWAAMPNLELFANAGFPFTRFADLSQTDIVMPPTASSGEIGLYLMLVSYFGEQTGYPALRLHIGAPARHGQRRRLPDHRNARGSARIRPVQPPFAYYRGSGRRVGPGHEWILCRCSICLVASGGDASRMVVEGDRRQSAGWPDCQPGRISGCCHTGYRVTLEQEPLRDYHHHQERWCGERVRSRLSQDVRIRQHQRFGQRPAGKRLHFLPLRRHVLPGRSSSLVDSGWVPAQGISLAGRLADLCARPRRRSVDTRQARSSYPNAPRRAANMKPASLLIACLELIRSSFLRIER